MSRGAVGTARDRSASWLVTIRLMAIFDAGARGGRGILAKLLVLRQLLLDVRACSRPRGLTA